MSVTRLNSNHRQMLCALVEKIVDCPAEQKAEQSAYDKAFPIVRKIVEAQFPPADMLIFRKYEQARQDRCIRVQLADGDVKQFQFRAEDAPWIPRNGNCSGRMYIADERQGNVVEKWVTAAALFKKTLDAKKIDYCNFINSSQTFEQVVEIWPEAAQLSDRIKLNLPAAVNPETLARITADSERRMRRAA